MARSVLELENFIENPRLHRKCGFHVQVIYYAHSAVMVFIDLFAILFGLVLFTYPHKHRELAIYRQMFQYYDRIYAYHYQLIYNILILTWIFLFFLHIMANGFAILAAQKKKPWLQLPQLVLLILRIGILLALFFGFFIINIIGDELMMFLTFIIFFFLICALSFLVSSVFCFRYILERYNVIQKVLASAKSVRFKERKRHN